MLHTCEHFCTLLKKNEDDLTECLLLDSHRSLKKQIGQSKEIQRASLVYKNGSDM